MMRSLFAVIVLATGCSGGGKDKPVASKPPPGVSVECPAGTELKTLGRGLGCENANGRKHGPVVRWNEQGLVTQRGAYRDDKMHGEWRSFHPNGKKASVVVYRDGREHGHLVWWYPSGVKSSESSSVDGRYHGTRTNWDRQGNVTEINEYVQGQRTKSQAFKNGKKVSEQNWEVWFPTGKAVITTHGKIPAEWQTCKASYECVLQAKSCCACGAGDSVAINFRYPVQARKALLPHGSCKSARCPSQLCQRVGARCDDGRCVSAQ